MGETIWTCEGDVRGGCGIAHRSKDAAWRCCDRDAIAVRRGNPGGGAYSDRRPVHGPPRGATVRVELVQAHLGTLAWARLLYRGVTVGDTEIAPKNADYGARERAESIARERGWRVAP